MKPKRLLILALGVIFLFTIIPNSSVDQVYPNDSGIPQVQDEQSTPSYGEPWLQGFPYRKGHIIEGSTGAGSDYQVKIRVHSGSGVDSGDLVNLPSSVWLVDDPIRFTDDDGVTLLDYWKESTSGNTSTYWVEIRDNLDNDVTIYVYYGNGTAPDLSNGTSTFIFFDDFESGDFSHWDSAEDEWSIDSDNVKSGSYSALGNSTYASGSDILRKNLTITENCLFHIWYYVEESLTKVTFYLQVADGEDDIVTMLIDYGFNQLRYLRLPGDVEMWPDNSTYSDGVWFSLELAYDFDTGFCYAWNDGSAMGSLSMTDYPDGGDVTSISALTAATASSTKVAWMDDYYVRKWTLNEPEHGAWGPEENDNAPSLDDSVPWLENFPYRRAHAINGSLGAGTNYQVEIRIHSGIGTDSGNLVNLPSGLWTPSDPVRFTDNDGTTLLDYWKEYYDTEDAIYWVEVNDNLDYDTVIYLYYGNNTQPSLSNGTATFLFFDDFESGSLEKWDSVESQWSTTTADKKYGTYAAHYDGLLSGKMSVQLPINQSGIMIHSWYKPESYLRGGYYHFYATVQGRTEGVQAHDYYWQYWNGTQYTKYGDSAGVGNPPNWDRCELGINLQTQDMMLWVNRTYLGAASEINNLDGNNITQSELIYRVELSGSNNWEHWADDYYVRKWLPSEPVQVGWNDAQSPTIDNPSDLSFDEGSSNSTETTIIWTPYDQFPALYRIYKSESLIRSGLWNSSSEKVSVSTMGLAAGQYSYTLEVVDVAGRESNDTVGVTVNDIIAPTIDSPSDVIYSEGETGHSIVWDPQDANPSNYTITRNGTLVKSGDWNSTLETISINVDNLTLGLHVFVVTVSDTGDNWVNDTVLVTVQDTTSPTLDSPIDVGMDEGDLGISIVWNPSDLHPSSYTVLENGSAVKSGSWNSSSEAIELSLDGLALGFYNYTIVVSDTSGNSAVDTVLVTVSDTTDPVIDSPSDLMFGLGESDFSITWSPSDLHPSTYVILENGSEARAGNWNSSSESISISLDGLALGFYNYTLVVTDTSGNSASDTVFVTVHEVTPPGVTEPPDLWYELGSTGNELNWTLTDENPFEYRILNGSETIRNWTAWTNGELVTISVDGLEVGTYNYTIEVVDLYGNNATDFVYVHVVDTTPPIVSSPSDIIYEVGTTDNNVTWTLNDLSPYLYRIVGNGTTRDWTPWTDGSVATISADGLPTGVYNYTIEVRDVYNNTATDHVSVTVEDTTAPVINSPNDIDCELGSTNNILSWNATEYEPYQFEILGNGTTTPLSYWNGSAIEVSLDGLTLGVYNYTVVLYDVSGNSASDTVIVTVIDTTPPSVDSPLDALIQLGTTGNRLTWNASELAPAYYELVGNGTNVPLTAWNGSSLTFSIDGYDYGIYNLTLVLWDSSGNSANDTVFVEVVDTQIPLISPPSDIEYEMGTTGHQIIWSPSDADPMYWEVSLDGAPISSGPWNGSQIVQPIDGLGVGIYVWSLFVNDTNGNWARDNVTVTVVDTTLPYIDSPSDLHISEGTSGSDIVWNPSDLNPEYYIVYQNGTEADWGTWDGGQVSFNVDGLGMGIYNLCLYLNDTSGNEAWDCVLLYVEDTTLPVIDGLSDFQYELGHTGHHVNWTATDLHPLWYEVYLDGIEIDSGTFTSPLELSFSTDGLDVGEHNYTLVVEDTSANVQIHTVIVTVLPDATPPVLTGSGDLSFVHSITGYNVTWSGSDINRDAYSLLLNGSVHESGTWDWTEYTLDLDGFLAGLYNFTMVVRDVSGQEAHETIMVLIHPNVAPSITPPMDIQMSEDDPGQITWSVSDVDPLNYSIHRDGALLDMGLWNGSNIVVELAGISLGTYSFMLTLWDQLGNSAYDIVLVEVLAESVPPIIDHPADDSYVETGSLLLTWEVTDAHPSSYVILIDGIEVDSGSWDGTPISYTLSGLGVGMHNVTLVVYDSRGNWAADSVFVTVQTDFNAFLMRASMIGGLGFVLPAIVIGAVVVSVRRRRRRSSLEGYVDEKKKVEIQEIADFFELPLADTLSMIESTRQALLTIDGTSAVSTKAVIADIQQSLGEEGRVNTTALAREWDIERNDIDGLVEMTGRKTLKVRDGDHVELTYLRKKIEDEVSQDGRLSTQTYRESWKLDSADVESALATFGTSMVKNNEGDFISREHIENEISKRIARSGGFDVQETADEWRISSQSVHDIASDLHLDLLHFDSGRVLARSYAQNQMMNLLDEEGAVHITKVCRALDIRKEDAETLASVVGDRVLLTESGMFVLLKRAAEDIRNRFSTSGRVLADEMSEKWGLSASETERIVSATDVNVLRMTTGGFVLADHVTKEVLQGITARGEINPGGLATKLDLDDSDIRTIISNMSLDVVESEKGTLLSVDRISTAIEERISSHGAADFRLVEKDLGITSARLLVIAKKKLASKYRILEDALIITTQKWLDRVRAEAIDLQKVHLSSFANEHGVTEQGLLVILQRIVGGSVDPNYGLFVVDREREVAPPRASKTEDVNVDILRGGEFVGNRFRFKVKIVNKSDTIITDVSAVLTAYPRESLKLDDERPRFVSKIEPGGFRSLPFEFTPTQDCVKGQLIATVAYMDSRGNAYSGTTKPFEIRAVCDLLVPEAITDKQYEAQKASLDAVDLSDSVDGWLPDDMHRKVERTLRESNFFDVGKEDSEDGFRRIGWAKGKYTGSHVGAEVMVEPTPDRKGSIIHLRLSGEDTAMLMPAMDELKRKINPWNCPVCSSKLDAESVRKIKEGIPTTCQYCGTTLTE